MAKRNPVARESGLAMEHLDDELLVYDLERDKAYYLNRTAALVWKLCDGRNSPEEIAQRLNRQLGGSDGVIDERVVWCALEQLGRDRLLSDRLRVPARLAWTTRRQHLRAIGKVAAVAVPVVTAMIAPTPAMAATCRGGCTTGCPGQVCCCNPVCHCVNNCAGQCQNRVSCC